LGLLVVYRFRLGKSPKYAGQAGSLDPEGNLAID